MARRKEIMPTDLRFVSVDITLGFTLKAMCAAFLVGCAKHVPLAMILALYFHYVSGTPLPFVN